MKPVFIYWAITEYVSGRQKPRASTHACIAWPTNSIAYPRAWTLQLDPSRDSGGDGRRRRAAFAAKIL
jgi:hypothetical protein